MPTLKLPNLATLLDRPSWLNRAGRIDRSACLEVRASYLWPRTDLYHFRTHPRERSRHTAPRPGREATASYCLTADVLLELARHHLPRTLAGDWRTQKSNAMKLSRGLSQFSAPENGTVPLLSSGHTSGGPSGGWGLSQFSAPENGTVPLPSDFGLPANPNKDATRTKMFGLPTDWRQTIKIERWRLHERLAQHFLICPHCERKCVKLFLPLCTEAELRDALTAQLWYRTHESSLNRKSPIETRKSAQRLAARYSLLFEPRRLLCRQCLGLRYGEAKRNRK